MKKCLALFLTMIFFASNVSFAIVTDDFVEETLSKNLKTVEYKKQIIKDELITEKFINEHKNETYKLNINKFIGIENINKSTTRNNIKITVNRKRIYMDYETYEIEVENNSSGKIELDSLQKTNTVYIEDENGQKYYWYNHEILEEDISIRRAQKGSVEVKFNKSYQAEKETTKVVFTNVVANEHNVIRIEIGL